MFNVCYRYRYQKFQIPLVFSVFLCLLLSLGFHKNSSLRLMSYRSFNCNILLLIWTSFVVVKKSVGDSFYNLMIQSQSFNGPVFVISVDLHKCFLVFSPQIRNTGACTGAISFPQLRQQSDKIFSSKG